MRLGRFITQDPIHSGNNWYSYCSNNPVSGTDPSGLSMGLPGTLGAPDQRHGGFGGSLGEGGDGLDSFFSAEDAAMERGHQGYLLSVNWPKLWQNWRQLQPMRTQYLRTVLLPMMGLASI